MLKDYLEKARLNLVGDNRLTDRDADAGCRFCWQKIDGRNWKSD